MIYDFYLVVFFLIVSYTTGSIGSISNAGAPYTSSIGSATKVSLGMYCIFISTAHESAFIVSLIGGGPYIPVAGVGLKQLQPPNPEVITAVPITVAAQTVFFSYRIILYFVFFFILRYFTVY